MKALYTLILLLVGVVTVPTLPTVSAYKVSKSKERMPPSSFSLASSILQLNHSLGDDLRQERHINYVSHEHTPKLALVFPSCNDICARYELMDVKAGPHFGFGVWNVTCHDEFCVVKNKAYSSNQIPNSDELEIKFDVHVERFQPESRSLAKLHLQFEWIDPNLEMCDCGDGMKHGSRHEDTVMDMEDILWLPTFYFANQQELARTGFLSKESIMDLRHPKDASVSTGVQIHWSVRCTVRMPCITHADSWPFTKQLCYFRVMSYNLREEVNLVWEMNKLTWNEHIDANKSENSGDGNKILIRSLCEEESGCFSDPCRDMDGFKVYIQKDYLKMTDYFRVLASLNALMAILCLLLPTNPPRVLGAHRMLTVVHVFIGALGYRERMRETLPSHLMKVFAMYQLRMINRIWISMILMAMTNRIRLVPWVFAYLIALIMKVYVSINKLSRRWKTQKSSKPTKEVKESSKDEQNGEMVKVNEAGDEAKKADEDDVEGGRFDPESDNYDPIAHGWRIVEFCQLWICHFRITNKFLFAIFIFDYFTMERVFWIYWREVSSLGPINDIIAKNCTCDCNDDPPLFEKNYQ